VFGHADGRRPDPQHAAAERAGSWLEHRIDVGPPNAQRRLGHRRCSDHSNQTGMAGPPSPADPSDLPFHDPVAVGCRGDQGGERTGERIARSIVGPTRETHRQRTVEPVVVEPVDESTEHVSLRRGRDTDGQVQAVPVGGGGLVLRAAWEVEHVARLEGRRAQSGDVPVFVAVHLHDEDVVDVGVALQPGRRGRAEVGVHLYGMVEFCLERARDSSHRRPGAVQSLQHDRLAAREARTHGLGIGDVAQLPAGDPHLPCVVGLPDPRPGAYHPHHRCAHRRVEHAVDRLHVDEVQQPLGLRQRMAVRHPPPALDCESIDIADELAEARPRNRVGDDIAVTLVIACGV
jgi:hypothetical protein